MRVRAVLASDHGAGRATDGDLLFEGQGAIIGVEVPHVNLTLAEGGANEDRFVFVELEEDDAGGAGGVLDESEVVGVGVKLTVHISAPFPKGGENQKKKRQKPV